MFEFLRELFSADAFMPHAHCYAGRKDLIFLHLISDASIGAAYVVISTLLGWLVYRVRDLPFQWMYTAFGVFIIACGMTHFMEVWTLYTPYYWLSGLVKGVTALASVGTALLLPPLLPKAEELARAATQAHERGIKLETAFREVQTAYERTRELEALKTSFFANVSHELRTPLALILGPTEKLLGSGALAPDGRRDVELIQRNARILLHHVNDLLDLSKLEASQMVASYADVDVARLVRLATGHFDGIAAERAVAFAVRAPETAPAQVDPEKLDRVLVNLLSNAFKFTPPGGRIRCSLDIQGRLARIEVADSGPGIPREMREAAFERFRQLEGGSTRRFGGTGLGLAIARDLVHLQCGTISIGDAPEGGALLAVTVPLRAPAGASVRPDGGPPEGAEPLAGDHARAVVETLRTHAGAASTEGTAERPRLLVVEDNPDMSRFLVDTLAADYRVTTAADGRAGLDAALASPPDLILTDVMMPTMSGDELVTEVRRRRELDGVPVIVLSAKADDELRVRLLRDGAQDYVMKPFAIEEVRARVRTHVALKRARDVLQQELEGRHGDVEALAREVSWRKRELGTALDSMAVAREHAERASQVKSQFLSLMSHELRTPLTSLQIQLTLLERARDGGLTPAQRDAIARIASSSRRMIELVDTLLEYARVQSGKMHVAPEPFDLARVVTDAVDEVRPQAEQKGLALRLIPPPAELPRCTSDPRLVRLIVMNLLGNAVKFTKAGHVEIAVGASESHHRIAVTDTGPGIPADQVPQLFEPFKQLDRLEHKHVYGVGLGLSLVKQIVEVLEGRIEVSSEVGRGSTFAVILPPIVTAPGTKSAFQNDP